MTRAADAETPAHRPPLLLAAAAACVVAPALVAVDVESLVTLVAVVLLVSTAPGAALLPFLAPRGAALEAGLVVGVSLAVSTLVAQTLLWVGAWRPEAALYVVAATCLPALISHLAGRSTPLRRR